MRSPHLLFVLTDQHLATTLGCYGSTLVSTPHLDALARDGLLFTNAYAACPICAPARASLQTGLLPFRHGMQTNIYQRGCLIHELPDHPTLLPRRLRQLGYSVAAQATWPFLRKYSLVEGRRDGGEGALRFKTREASPK
jgi:arylsulfatase A-like enzyme